MASWAEWTADQINKPCSKCGIFDRYPNGTCKPCRRAERADYYKRNSEKVKASSKKYYADNIEKKRAQAKEHYKANPVQKLFHRTKVRAKKDGYAPMTLEDCERAVASKPELCVACQENPATHCDHSHTTGKFRGWLCQGCNTAEGILRTVERASRLLEYIRNHNG